MDELYEALDGALADGGRRWLDEALTFLSLDPGAITELFPATGLNCGRAPLAGPPGWTADEAARTVLLCALPTDRLRPAELYLRGGTAERRAILKALPHLIDRTAEGDARTVLAGIGADLVAAALGDPALAPVALGAVDALDGAAYRRAVLACVRAGVPLSAVQGLERRDDPLLARELAARARDLVVAGRRVPRELWCFVQRHPDVLRDIAALLAPGPPVEGRRMAWIALTERIAVLSTRRV
ncbi:EboA domain-containing protein [Actinomadura craniellae]|uniref:EboA domain-containing protein n=1 Tax=Actinomadura craniellae TaxID=2231787 RepID=UPI0018F191AE|nr:EboA domain-containing protein [Actinomadura craniellae]